MSTLASILLALTLLLCGGYAGMVLMCHIAILPAMRQLRPGAYADTWRALDLYMDRLMPPYKGALLLVNLGAIITVTLCGHRPLVIATTLSLLCSLAGLVLTIRGQLPLNKTLKSLAPDAPEPILLDIRDKTIQRFTPRFYLAMASFAALCLGIALWPLPIP